MLILSHGQCDELGRMKQPIEYVMTQCKSCRENDLTGTSPDIMNGIFCAKRHGKTQRPAPKSRESEPDCCGHIPAALEEGLR